MSKTWKWILGILVILVILGVVVAGVFVWRNQAMMASNFRRAPVSQGPSAAIPSGQATPAPNGPNGSTPPYGFNGRRNPMGAWGGHGPMMGGRDFSRFGGFMPFGMGLFFLGGLLRLILPLAVLALVAWIFYRMGKRAGAATVAPTPAPAPVEPSDPPKGGRKVAKT